MNFDDAVQAHQKWKSRLRMLIDGTSQETLDPAVISLDNRCDLGKWIHGDAKKYAGRPEYTGLQGEHARFHLQAAQVVRKAIAGDKVGAERLLAGDYYQASSKVVAAIRSMRQAV